MYWVQCAQLAEDNGERSELIIACLLVSYLDTQKRKYQHVCFEHDIGHLILNETPEMQRTVNLKHEDIGANWLSQYFVSDVSEAVRYHVPAKRYLCGVDPEYWNNLYLHFLFCEVSLRIFASKHTFGNLFLINKILRPAMPVLKRSVECQIKLCLFFNRLFFGAYFNTLYCA